MRCRGSYWHGICCVMAIFSLRRRVGAVPVGGAAVPVLVRWPFWTLLDPFGPFRPAWAHLDPFGPFRQPCFPRRRSILPMGKTAMGAPTTNVGPLLNKGPFSGPSLPLSIFLTVYLSILLSRSTSRSVCVIFSSLPPSLPTSLHPPPGPTRPWFDGHPGCLALLACTGVFLFYVWG